MWGIILTAIGTFLEEISTLIGKAKVAARQESIYTMGFLQLLGMVILWGTLIVITPAQFIFSKASLPTFALRAILEIAQSHFTVVAIIKADRSTYGFLRTGTMPLLLLVDLILGYTIHLNQILGIGIIIVALIFLFINHGLNRKGLGPVLFSTINAVATISLFKYDITHFNSIPAEQLLTQIIVILYFLGAAIFIAKENPFAALKKPPLFIQSLTQGIAGIVDSFAYGLAPASIIMSARRSSSVVWSILSGNLYFHEKKLALKIGAVLIITIGIILLV